MSSKVANPKRLSEKKVKECLAELSWFKLEQHLETLSELAADVPKLCGLIRRSEPLLFKRGDPPKQKVRSELLENLKNYLITHNQINGGNFLATHIIELEIIENAFQGILELVSQGDWANIAPTKRVAAIIQLFLSDYEKTVHQAKGMSVSSEVVLNSSVTVYEDGAEVDFDSNLESIQAGLLSVLHMEAHQNQWFLDDNILSVPEYVPLHFGNTASVLQHQKLAQSWLTWDSAQMRVRYKGAKLACNLETNDLTVDVNLKDEIFDNIANQRLADRLRESVILQEIFGCSFNYTSSKSVFFPPTQFFSKDEENAFADMTHVLSVRISDVDERFAGLRLIEWLRGYSLLKKFAEAHLSSKKPKYLIRYSRFKLCQELARVGFESELASKFIDNVCVRKGSRDMFDQPLLRLTKGGFLLFAPMIGNALLPQLLLSIMTAKCLIGEKPVQIKEKGKRFEHRVLQLLEKNGLNAKKFLVRRNGSEFDYDAVFVWDDFLFIFECKNQSLSSNHPIASYYFELSNGDYVEQVQRLANALIDYPDILIEYLPEGVGKKIIPCIVNALPYSIPNGIDGVFFTDFGVLEKFFDGRISFIRSNLPNFDHQGLSLWADRKPSGKDLIATLMLPFQVYNAAMHTKINIGNGLLNNNRRFYSEYLQRCAMTASSMIKSMTDYKEMER